MRSFLFAVLGISGIYVGWQFLCVVYPPAIIPSSGSVGGALWEILRDGDFSADLAATLWRVTGSFMLSLLIGTGLGILAGVQRDVLATLHPVMVMAESAPPVAWLVVAILLFGMGSAPSFMVGLSAAVPIFFFNTVSAVRGLDRQLIEMARAYKVRGFRLFSSVYLPGIVLSSVAASSASLSVIWRVIIMAEAFTSAQGFGPRLWGAYLYAEADVVYAYIVLIVCLGFGLEYGVIRPGSNWLKVKLRMNGDGK
ncbi:MULTISPECIES: ABC transporter permease [Prosthecochloris]|uniref:ABC transporter permease subunit n=1 Tax=Prosthecochloris vibrioformis TaxID=1098 RepID=A0A5C4RYY3_PROVB|nr:MULTISPECIES: ABC transporter permease subunit [Prosthecochloris]ANT64739.1 Putative aliphatic sulfonates transport permease protein SsuC [Prosthecochloris sp. CIB 2401]TNJ36139.1 ABC transporter permease subunit [Prosthecochloris vibrioformis]